MLLPNRNASTDAYRYGFQGQEKDDEIKGEGNSLNYKYRMHDPRVGRFFATDPLEPKFAYNSPYSFSENRVLDMVELEGLEIYSVHGTFVTPKTWAVLDNENWKTVKDATGNVNKVHFKWDGLNLHKSRTSAAMDLANMIEATRTGQEPITIVGHSHGGNVGIEATNILIERGIEVDYLVTINTPVRKKDGKQNHYELSSLAKKEVKHLHIAHKNDYVVLDYGGGDNIKNKKVVTRGGRKYSLSKYGDRNRTGRLAGVSTWSGEYGESNLLFGKDYLSGYSKFSQILLPASKDSKAGALISDEFHDSHNRPQMWSEWFKNAIEKFKTTEKVITTKKVEKKE